MKQVVYLALGWAAVAAAPVQAEWQPVVNAANSVAYADPASIRRSETSATMHVLIDYAKPPFDGNNLPYLSLTMRNEYRCTDSHYRVLTITSHAGNMGRGERPYTSDEPGEWEAVSPRTVQGDLMKVACGDGAAQKEQPGATPSATQSSTKNGA